VGLIEEGVNEFCTKARVEVVKGGREGDEVQVARREGARNDHQSI